MSLEELQNRLEGIDGGNEIFEMVSGLVQSEKERGIQSTRKANKQVEKYKPFRQAVESLGWQDDVDVSEWSGSVKSTIDQYNAHKDKLTDFDKIKAQVNSLTERLNQAEQEKQKLQESSRRQKLQEIAMSSLKDDNGEWRANEPEVIVKAWQADNQIKLSEDGKEAFWVDGDNELPIKEGASKWLEGKKGLLRTTQKGGSGSSPHAQSKSQTAEERRAFVREYLSNQ